MKGLVVPADRYDAEVQRWLRKGMTVEMMTPGFAVLTRGRPEEPFGRWTPVLAPLFARHFLSLLGWWLLQIWWTFRPLAVGITVREERERAQRAMRALLTEDLAALADRPGWTVDGPTATFRPSLPGWSATVRWGTLVGYADPTWLFELIDPTGAVRDTRAARRLVEAVRIAEVGVTRRG
jgi:hypothetical protein